MSVNFFRNRKLGLDLGNNNTVVSDASKVLLNQPSYIVFDADRSIVKAVGQQAFEMFDKSHGQLRPVKPLRAGVIADAQSASRMLQEMIKSSGIIKSFYEGFDEIICGVPFAATSVEKQALLDTLSQFHPRRSYLIHEPVAAAIGMGLNISEPNGKMIVDIGGGITEIVIISLSGIATYQTLKVAGDYMDTTIQDYLNKAYGLSVGIRTAEQIKINAGAAVPLLADAPEPFAFSGKEIVTGLPVKKLIGYSEVQQVLERSIQTIESAILSALESCPPELASDIYDNGIYLTGGNALLRGLPERLARVTGLPIHLDPTPLLSVAQGINTVLRDGKRFAGLMHRA